QQVEHLAPRFRVVRYDCRGFGASGPFDPAIPYTHAGDLAALLDHLAIGQAVLAGLSFGGRVVLQAALAGPARGRGLALLDAGLDGVPVARVWGRPRGVWAPGAGARRAAGRPGQRSGAPAVRPPPPAARRGQPPGG